MFTQAKTERKRYRRLEEYNTKGKEMIKAIIFDFDKTLYSGISWKNWPNFVIGALYKVVKDQQKVEHFVEKYGIRKDASQTILAEACINEGFNFKKIRRYLKTHVCPLQAKDGKKLSTISNDFLISLSKRYPLYLISLSEKKHIKFYAKKYGISLKPFKKIITLNPLNKSKAVEMKKVVEAEKLNPEEVLMVGDNPVHDIEAAKSVGLQTFLFNEDYEELYDFFRVLTNVSP